MTLHSTSDISGLYGSDDGHLNYWDAELKRNTDITVNCPGLMQLLDHVCDLHLEMRRTLERREEEIQRLST